MINLEEEISKIPEIKFYNILLDVVAGTENVNEYLEKYTDCPCSNLEKKYITKFIKNYNIYKNYLTENSYEKYCSYFKHWLHREKLHIPRGNNNNVLNNWKQCVPCLLDKLEQENNKPNTKCNFKNADFNYAFVQIKIILDHICSIKGQKDLIENVKTNRKLCISFNEKIDEYIVSIFKYLSSISDNIPWKKEYIKVNNSCSGGNVYNLISKIQCPSEESTEVQELESSCTPQPIIQQTCAPNTCINLEHLCQQLYTTQKTHKLDELCKGRCTSQPPHDLKILCPEYCAENPTAPVHTNEGPVNPDKNPYLQLPVTIFSSVVGTIFFFLFLYKFTPFRSWFLNRIGSKKTLKHKIKQDMEQEFLGAPFHPPYVDDQNSRPRVGYSQN
ncbi:PIR protein [Plasmodium vivax]|uniref:VIR protein n=1 Tax=Plasmodium vivax TaxID=5855 RepID=A0A564ZUA1_PLAVI|nr:PIR protein [Plasmodium vivax]